MKYFYLLMILVFLSPVVAVSSDLDPQISKLEFQGVHFGDFPSVDMICVRGLCPVGELGVGISNNSFVPPSYNHETAITHYHGVKISTPEFSYFEDRMFKIKFSIECRRQGIEECVDAVKTGLDAEYGLVPVEQTGKEHRSPSLIVDEFLTESGSLVAIVWSKEGKGRPFPSVSIFDRFLMDKLRKSYNPNYVPPKIKILDLQESAQSKLADN